MDELKMAAHMRDVMLSADRVKNEKLEATLEHFKRHMKERESTLEDKEKGILDLRRKNVTLDGQKIRVQDGAEKLIQTELPKFWGSIGGRTAAAQFHLHDGQSAGH